MLRIGQIETTAQNNQYTDGSVAGGIAATRLRAAAFNAIQEELAHIIETTGVVLNVNDTTQVLTALQKLLLSRANPFADIKADGTVNIGLTNLGLGAIAGLGTPTGSLSGGIIRIPMYNGTTVETLILQWMAAPALAAGGNATVTFPTAFPNALLSLIATGGATAAGVPGINTFSIGSTSCRIYNQSTSVSTQAGAIWALGK
ncbi:gp53-like domain-containing protein [Phytobacter ursingii]